MLTIDRVKLIDDHRFSLLTPTIISTMNTKQDNGHSTATNTMNQQLSLENSQTSADWSLVLSEPSDSDSGE